MAGLHSLRICLLLLTVGLELVLTEEDSPLITIAQGPLKGKKETPSDSGPYYVFLGIPYAKPPVGELRFKAPLDAEPWNGTLEALQEGRVCRQFDILDQQFKGEEDCLFLNVYTPELPGSNPLKPVMVWIHGGGFMAGSGNKELQNPELLLDAGVVYVSINYRLGPFGFLTTEDSVIPGNAGLKDQVQALRWVQQNIAAFGGDPTKVTIFGESAGGASVHYHVVSPMSRGLFHGAIAQSGTTASPWTIAVRPRELTHLAANALGFSGNSSQELADFLRTVDAQKLLEVSSVAVPEREKHRIQKMPYVPSVEPTVEGETSFLPAHPLRLMEEGKFNQVPFITGITSDEGIALLKISGLQDNEVQRQEFNQNLKSLIHRDLRTYGVGNVGDDSVAKIKTFYFGEKPLDNSTYENVIRLFTDLSFAEGTVQTLNLMSSHGSAPVYMYQMSYDGGLGVFKRILNSENLSGVSHADDLGYIFKFPSTGPNAAKDQQVRSEIITLWTNFAKTGNPTSGLMDENIPNWPPYTKNETNYLDIGAQLQIKRDLNKERMDFWQELYSTPKMAETVA